MPGNSLLATALIVGAGGAILSGSALLLDIVFGKRAGWWLTLPCAALLLVLATGCWLRGEPMADWWPLTVFLAVILLGSLAYLHWVRQFLVWSLRPNIIWWFLMGACLVTVNWAAVELSRRPDPAAHPANDLRFGVRRPVQKEMGLTDAGRQIGFHEYTLDNPGDQSAHDGLVRRDLTIADRHRHFVIRLREADHLSNCHGFVFADARFAIEDSEVPFILTDNQYVEVSGPLENDLVIYHDSDGIVTHSGIIRFLVPNGPVLVESKWGPLGVYLHPVENSPYGSDYSFFHTSRPTHTLNFSPTEVEPDP